MADSLSRSEVESLLSALDPKRPELTSEPASPRHEYSAARTASRSSSSLARSAVLFCETVRKRIEVVWEPLLREPMRMKRHMPRTLAFTELLDRSRSSHFGFLVESKQERGDLILLFERELVGPLLSRVLGNSGAKSHPVDLSELELRVLQRMLQECFREMLPLSHWSMTSLGRLDFDAERAARSGRTSWWVESWEMKAESLRGNVLLAGEWEFVSNCYGSSPGLSAEDEHRVDPGSSQLVAEIDSIPLEAETIRFLQPGDTLPAGENIEHSVQILVDGEPRWLGRAVVHGERNAVEIAAPAKHLE